MRGERAFVSGFVELAARVRPAGGVFDLCFGVPFLVGAIGGVAVALHDPFEAGEGFIEAFARAAGVPFEKDGFAGRVVWPQVALPA